MATGSDKEEGLRKDLDTGGSGSQSVGVPASGEVEGTICHQAPTSAYA